MLESLGFSEWERYESGLVEFCREGDEATADTIILQDNPWFEWASALNVVAHSTCLTVDEFVERALQLSE